MSFHLQFPKCYPSAVQRARCQEAAGKALLLQIPCVGTSEGHRDCLTPLPGLLLLGAVSIPVPRDLQGPCPSYSVFI